MGAPSSGEVTEIVRLDAVKEKFKIWAHHPQEKLQRLYGWMQ